MKMKTLAIAAALSLAAGSASAITITNGDGTTSWTGFDWASGGTAFTTGFDGSDGNNFTMTAFAWATSLKDGVTTLNMPGLDINANGALDSGKTYEYTLVATLNETVVGCTGTACTFSVLGGTFDIYYDLSGDANALAGSNGTGFTDGTKIISGTINPLAGQVFDTAQGFNSTALKGVVTSTNGTYIVPSLDTTTAVTTLQIGTFVTDWVNPGGFDGTAFGESQVVFQADANQNFQARVPEPASLALIGLGLGLIGFSTYRRKKS